MDNIPIGVLFSLLAVLIVLSAFFSSSETAMMALNRYRLKHLANKGHRSATLASTLLERPDRLIGIILLGNNFVNILASSIATIISIRLWGEAGIAIGAGLLTFVILIFAEVTPKTLAALNPERVAFPASYPLIALLYILSPFVWIINGISNRLLRLLGLSSGTNQDALTVAELRTAVTDSQEHFEDQHQDMLLRLLDLESVTIDDVMVAQNEIETIDISDEWDDIVEQLVTSHHSRIVVCENSFDHILGTLHLQRVFRLLADETFNLELLLTHVRPPYFVPEKTPLLKQLTYFREHNRHMSIVVDEYGTVRGLVSIQDILEEIVGEVSTRNPQAVENIKILEHDGSTLVDGSEHIRDINRKMGWHLPTTGAKTISGAIVEYLEDIPSRATSILLDGYPIEIIQVSGNIIKTARIWPKINAERKS